ncbi:MAG: glycosyltransferase [Anaerolineae bacterium]|nr:glycosyltransferase [Anaerolineae bacterium]
MMPSITQSAQPGQATLCLAQVSPRDIGGGAERIALDLHQAYRAQGVDSYLVVGTQQRLAADVFALPSLAQKSGAWTRTWLQQAQRLEDATWPGSWRLRRWAHSLATPRKQWAAWRGWEDMHHPGSADLLRLPPCRPDLLHLHNLHGGYFDLRALRWLSAQVPLLLTLHDEWLLTGHCGYSINCERWRTGCGHCPDLKRYPAVQRDATAFNWRRKQQIYARSRLVVATPSAWLMERVRASILMAGVIETRVIPNGVDLDRFAPAEDRRELRQALGLPPDALICLFTGQRPRRNSYKDFPTIYAAFQQFAMQCQSADRQVVLLILGDEGPPETLNERAQVRFVPFQSDETSVARIYQAADLYLHAARADNFPNVILEALASGLPVIATGVGGIPEQVQSLEPGSRWVAHSPEAATGWLVETGDSAAMAAAIHHLAQQPSLHAQLARNAVQDARQRFSLALSVERYLQWSAAIVAQETGQAHA